MTFVWFNEGFPLGLSHGLLILARELTEAGHAVDLVHLHASRTPLADVDALLDALRRARPDLLGFSFGSAHAADARRLAGIVARALPDVPIVCGGLHPTLCPEEVLAWPGVAAIGRGEVDGGPLVAFVDGLAAQGEPPVVPGFWVRRGAAVLRGAPVPFPDLARSVLPRYDLVDAEALVQAKRGFGEVLAGRGCPHACRFCQNAAVRRAAGGRRAGAYCRVRPVDAVLAEIADLRARAPSLRAIMFADDRLAADPGWLAAFGARYAAEVGLPYVVNATADQLTDATARSLASSGCNLVKLGVECGSDERRRHVLGRPHDTARIRRAFATLRRQGLNTMAYLMVGLPGETPDDLQATFRLAAELRPDVVRVSMFCPYPGTALHRDLLAAGALDPSRMETPYGFTSRSVLRWPPEMEAALASVMAGWPALLSTLLQAPDGVQPRYEAPMPDRPDYAVLRGVPRARALVNLD